MVADVSPDRGTLVLIDRRGLGPQVELGPVGLDLAPDSERTEREQRKYQYFLHARILHLG